MAFWRTLFHVLLLIVVVRDRTDAQSYDPAAGSPLVLTRAPVDGVQHYRDELQARTFIAAQRDAEAEPILSRLVEVYPRNGEHWLLLAGVRARLQKFAAAAEAYERAGAVIGLRTPVGWNPVNGAVNHLRAGNKAAALALLDRYVFEAQAQHRASLNDVALLAPLRDDPEFRRITGRIDTSGLSVTAGRQLDVDFLYGEVARVNQRSALPAEFNRRYQALRGRVGSMGEEQFVVELNRMLAALKQGHTELFSGAFHGKANSLPVQLYVFSEGIYIVNASEEYRSLVGSKVLAIGNTPAAEALRLVNSMQSVDGEMQFLWNGAYLLRLAHYLRGLGIIASVDTVSVRIETPQHDVRTVALVTGSFEGWQQLPPVRGVPTVYLDSIDRNYWMLPQPAQQALYVQVNVMRNGGAQSLPDFGRSVWTALTDTRARNLIIDLRHNYGGTTALYPELLKSIIAFAREPEKRLYVLIGRNTNSATANFITDLERLASPVFVGEPSSECCRLNGDPVTVELPYSGRRGVISAVQWNLSRDAFDGRRDITPHVPVRISAADYFNGRDPAMEAVARLISGNP